MTDYKRQALGLVLLTDGTPKGLISPFAMLTEYFGYSIEDSLKIEEEFFKIQSKVCDKTDVE